MSKRNAAPTIGWVVFSNVYKILAWLFIILMIVLLVQGARMKAMIDTDCYTPYNIKLGKYVLALRHTEPESCE